jgi:CheY-like chemotaxis protein
MRAARILVVDDDPWIQRRVASTLGLRGHQVSLAGDGAGALTLASKLRPDLIVTSASLPTTGGWSWWERLRADGPAADVPIVFLLSVPDTSIEVRGRLPADLSLGKPFRVEDLEKAVVKALSAEAFEVELTTTPGAIPTTPPRPHRAVDPTKPSSGFRPLSALRGALDQISLAALLTLLEMERKTGLVLLERPHGGSARLYLRKGRVVRADIESSPLSGAGAVYEALSWTEGGFDFLAGDVGGVDDIQTSTTFLLMEAARRQDEAREAAARPATGAEARRL